MELRHKRATMDMTLDLLETKLPEIRQFLLNNLDTFKRPRNIRNNNWRLVFKSIKDSGKEMDPLFGKCCPVSHFILFLSGGKGTDALELQLCNAKTFFVSPEGDEVKTVHWWCRSTKDHRILDLTKEQFIYGIPVESFYKEARKADFGFPYFRIRNQKSKIYNENVPSNTVLELGRRYQKQFGTAYGLDQWIQRYDEFDYELKQKELECPTTNML